MTSNVVERDIETSISVTSKQRQNVVKCDVKTTFTMTSKQRWTWRRNVVERSVETTFTVTSNVVECDVERRWTWRLVIESRGTFVEGKKSRISIKWRRKKFK